METQGHLGFEKKGSITFQKAIVHEESTLTQKCFKGWLDIHPETLARWMRRNVPGLSGRGADEHH